MSVLIKGVKMPKEGCKDCVLVVRKSVYDYCLILKQEVSGNVERGGRPAKCPLIDVPERKVGKWVDEPVYRQTIDGKTWDGFTYCSECKQMHEYGYRSKFCPNCGAEMKGESDDTD